MDRQTDEQTDDKEKKLARVVGFRVTEEDFKKIKTYLCPEDIRFAVMRYIADIYEE